MMYCASSISRAVRKFALLTNSGWRFEVYVKGGWIGLCIGESGLELDHLSLPLLVSSQLEVLTPLDWELLTEFAVGAFHPQYNLLSRLGLLVENRFCLSSISTLFPVVTPLTLCVEGGFACLVLRHLVVHVTLALLAVSAAGLRYVHHFEKILTSRAPC